MYTGFHPLWEGTTKRFDENSKIIVVDGNIGTDKVTVAKKIAEEFDMLFLPWFLMKTTTAKTTTAKSLGHSPVE
jgi:cytidylate kinase